MKAFLKMLIESFKEFKADKATTQAAALAYYAIFSLGPLVTIIIALLGIFYQGSDVSEVFVDHVSNFVGKSGEKVVSAIIEAGDKPSSSFTATIISTVTIIFGSTGVFVHLKEALNTAWGVKESAKDTRGIVGNLKARALALASVIVIFFLLLSSLIISSIISIITGNLRSDLFLISVIIQIINQAVSVGLIALLFAFIFKYLPNTQVAWKYVWIGSIFTSVLFNLGKYVIGIYLGKSYIGSVFGAAGSILVVLVWVYYSAMIVLFGAEFTQVYSKLYGENTVNGKSKLRPRKTSINKKKLK